MAEILTEKMKKCIILMIRINKTQREIAKELDVAEETISRWKKKETFKTRYKEEEKGYIQELSSPAIRTMSKLLNAKSEYVRFSVASNILDRTGYKPTDKVDISGDMEVNISTDYGEDE